MPMAPYAPPAQPGGAGQADATEQLEAGSAESVERWFLNLGTKVVGVQHYGGVVTDRENVVLRRQPSNPYDRNAIQVLNVRNEQLGHLPRELAAVLSPVMDDWARRADAGVEEV